MAVPRNAVHPSTFHKRGDRSMRGLLHSISERGVAGRKIMCHPEGRRNAFELDRDAKLRTEQHPPKYDHSRPCLVFVNLEYTMRSQVLNEAVRVTDYFLRL